MFFGTKLLPTRPRPKPVIVTLEVYRKVLIKDPGLGGQYRNKEQALIARMSPATYGNCLGGEEVERERTHFSFR